MFRLLIDDKIEDVAKLYAQKLFDKHPKLEKPISKDVGGNVDKTKGLFRLIKLLKGKENEKYRSYVSNIIKNFDAILKLKPSEFDDFKIKYFNQLTPKELEKKVISGNEKKFHELVVEFMKNDYAREKLIELTKDKLEITTCVYCNKNSPCSVDQYKAKANYPFLCISFYNMFPSCKDCNQLKGDREFSDDFVLYCEKGEEQDPYKFKLEDGLLNYVRTTPKNHENIIIDIGAKDGHSLEQFGDEDGHLKIKYRYNDKCFHAKEALETIYNICCGYGKEGLKVLKMTFPKLDPDQEKMLKFVLRDSIDVKNTHKCEFNKIKFDFGKLLKII